MARKITASSPAVWSGVVVLLGLSLLAPAQSSKTDDPMKRPLELIGKAKYVFSKVKDYSCNLIKRERLNGELSPNHLIALKVRNEAFSVSMIWLEPKDLEGQEVVYAEGKYEGKMRVKPGGLMGGVGFLSLPTNDARARETSKHKITSTGIGHLINECATGWEVEQRLKLTQVSIRTYLYAKRRCTRVELTHPTKAGGKFRHHKNILYFDQQTHLPIRVENYAWPDEEGDKPELVETFSYVNLKLNVGVADATFER